MKLPTSSIVISSLVSSQVRTCTLAIYRHVSHAIVAGGMSVTNEVLHISLPHIVVFVEWVLGCYLR